MARCELRIMNNRGSLGWLYNRRGRMYSSAVSFLHSHTVAENGAAAQQLVRGNEQLCSHAPLLPGHRVIMSSCHRVPLSPYLLVSLSLLALLLTGCFRRA